MKSECSCGCADVHTIATRRSSDDKIVSLWSDGAITFAFGFRVRGAGVARYACERKLNVRAGWIVMDLCSLYESSEVSALVCAARREVRANGAHDTDTADLERNVRHRMSAFSS